MDFYSASGSNKIWEREVFTKSNDDKMYYYFHNIDNHNDNADIKFLHNGSRWTR